MPVEPSQVFITNFPPPAEPAYSVQAYIMNLPETIPLESAIQTVVPIVLLLMVCLFSIYPFLMILKKLLVFAGEIAQSRMFTQLEKGGFWSRSFQALEFSPLDNQANSIKDTKFRIFTKRGKR